METPEARSGVVFICPDCDRVFKIHTNYMKMKEYVGKWFVYYHPYMSKNPEDILFPTYVIDGGQIFGKVWNKNMNGYINERIDFHYLEKEITREEAKKIIEGWYEINIKNSEETYQENLKGMFDEEAKE